MSESRSSGEHCLVYVNELEASEMKSLSLCFHSLVLLIEVDLLSGWHSLYLLNCLPLYIELLIQGPEIPR
jgi:hypothetical protein